VFSIIILKFRHGNKKQDIITKMVGALKVSDDKSTRLLLSIMLDSTGGLMFKSN
jgi:hypothetical protein